MITCHVRYVIDPYKVGEFEEYARLWLPIVARMGGTHHGYFLPAEGANNIAIALFSFPSLSAYEDYRQLMVNDPECIEAFALEKLNRSILSYERSFMRPVLPLRQGPLPLRIEAHHRWEISSARLADAHDD